ncbi:hypothetical protein N7510_001687 [Penicillium lagena]|uniref:uncharacterized protein n=1 Tax=Penicillium lagena TaxID=94218 RepID=UPI00253F9C06|nr:uncharacterized protein N7510_001687 [Penicillium lagena]KAJ5625378.1 hypothetical protein N7510_001687 [Penicillium lagena]
MVPSKSLRAFAEVKLTPTDSSNLGAVVASVPAARKPLAPVLCSSSNEAAAPAYGGTLHFMRRPILAQDASKRGRVQSVVFSDRLHYIPALF